MRRGWRFWFLSHAGWKKRNKKEKGGQGIRINCVRWFWIQEKKSENKKKKKVIWPCKQNLEVFALNSFVLKHQTWNLLGMQKDVYQGNICPNYWPLGGTTSYACSAVFFGLNICKLWRFRTQLISSSFLQVWALNSLGMHHLLERRSSCVKWEIPKS